MSSVTHPFQQFFLEQVMSDTLDEHDGKVSISDRHITNLRFANDTDSLAEEEEELKALVESLNRSCTRFKTEKIKLMTDSANGIQREITVKMAEAGYCKKLQVPYSSCFR